MKKAKSDRPVEVQVTADRLHEPVPFEPEEDGYDFTEDTWDDVQELIEAERDILRRAGPIGRLADVPTEFSGEFYDDARPDEPGVCAALVALGVAGCLPFEASNGSAFGVPFVRFWTRANWVAPLTDCARAARIGLVTGEAGGLEAYTAPDDVDGLLRFAECLRDWSTGFDILKG